MGWSVQAEAPTTEIRQALRECLDDPDEDVWELCSKVLVRAERAAKG